LTPPRRTLAAVALLAALWGGVLALAVQQPGYTDAYYYFNAAQRLAMGHGLTDATLWVYLNAPDHLPGPSHTYWMPLASLAQAASMALFGASFGGAQVASLLAFVGLAALGAWTGWTIGGTLRMLWLSALLVLFSGFFTPFWTTTDTFALFGLVGAACLLALGQGRATGRPRWFALAGTLAGLAHLARADGALLAGVVVLVALWPGRSVTRRGAIAATLSGALAYALVMLPWLLRNLAETGAPLPLGGAAAIWLRGYDELANYPPGASASAFFDWGLGNILRSRWDALRASLGTFVAVETWVVLGPFALAGLWRRRRDPLALGVALYAAALHIVMTVIFAYPGMRGGLFHSSAALLPFWAAYGLVGLDAGVGWAARRRRWPRAQAQAVFSGALIAMAALLSVGVLLTRLPAWNASGQDAAALLADLPGEAVIMANDPPAIYYHTGRAGVVVPNASPAAIPEIAARYGVTHLLLDANRTAPFAPLFAGEEAWPFLRLVRASGEDTPDTADDFRLFEVIAEAAR